MTTASIAELLTEYDRALAHTDSLWRDLTLDEVHWRAGEQASAIGWHLGHQAAVAHFMVRNLTAAEPRIDPELDALMDSATPEPDRGALPDLARLADYRRTVAERVHLRVGDIDAGRVGARPINSGWSQRPCWSPWSITNTSTASGSARCDPMPSDGRCRRLRCPIDWSRSTATSSFPDTGAGALR